MVIFHVPMIRFLTMLKRPLIIIKANFIICMYSLVKSIYYILLVSCNIILRPTFLQLLLLCMGRFVLECIFASLLEASAYVPRNDDNICILYEKRRAFSYFPLKNRWFQPPKDFMSRLTFFREVDSSMLAEKLRVIVTFLSNSFFCFLFTYHMIYTHPSERRGCDTKRALVKQMQGKSEHELAV